MAIKEATLDRILPHPLNAHVVTIRDRVKIANNIRRTGRYPALIVRELDEHSEYYPGESGWFQILDGHQRTEILQTLVEEGLDQYAIVQVDDWSPLTDDEALIALATLNSWGDNAPRKRAELLHHIALSTAPTDMAQILPETARQIEDAKRLLQRPMANIKRIIDEVEAPDILEISFVIPEDKKSTRARFLAALSLLADYYGAQLSESKHLDGAPPRLSIFTFNINTPSKEVIQLAVNRASAGLPPGTKNKRGQALETMARAYLAGTLIEDGLPEETLALEELPQDGDQKTKPKRKRRKT